MSYKETSNSQPLVAWEFILHEPPKAEWQDEQMEGVTSQPLPIDQVLISIQVLFSYVALFSSNMICFSLYFCVQNVFFGKNKICKAALSLLPFLVLAMA